MAGSEPSVVSHPVLLNPSEESVDLVWTVNSLSAGYVDIGTDADLVDSRRVSSGSRGMTKVDDRFLVVRIDGLTANTKFFYRTVTIPINFPDAYHMSQGLPVTSDIRSFSTMGLKSTSSFAVINDTHECTETMEALNNRLHEIGAAVTVWNGDICHQLKSAEHAASVFRQLSGHLHSATHPLLYTPGNHDYRGVWSRNLDKFLPPRKPAEREAQFEELGYNYAVRQGDIALIGMDTGEDKPDRHPAWAGLAKFEPYRRAQARWLERALEKPDITSAPFIVVICHIPLFDPNPDANPGDLLEGYAHWQRMCSDLWSPLLEKHHVQMVIAGHMHKYRFDAPSPRRSWAQMVGGGFSLNEKSDVTVIAGHIDTNQLVVAAYNAADSSVLNRIELKPRR